MIIDCERCLELEAIFCCPKLEVAASGVWEKGFPILGVPLKPNQKVDAGCQMIYCSQEMPQKNHGMWNVKVDRQSWDWPDETSRSSGLSPSLVCKKRSNRVCGVPRDKPRCGTRTLWEVSWNYSRAHYDCSNLLSYNESNLLCFSESQDVNYTFL